MSAAVAATQDDFARVQAVYSPVGAAALVVVAGAFAFALVRYRARDGRAPRADPRAQRPSRC